MQQKRCEEAGSPTRSDAGATAILRLLVRNHPGVMSHVCGLFHRRLFNVEGIACLPTADPSRSAVLLLVREDTRLEQVVRQLAKLADVVDIQRDPRAIATFAAVADTLGCPRPVAGGATMAARPVDGFPTGATTLENA